MARTKAAERRRHDQEAEQPRDHDDGVEAGTLPVEVLEVEPHPEFVEGEPQGDAVQKGRGVQGPPRRTDEEEIRARHRQEGDAEVQMMDMRGPELQVEVREPIQRRHQHRRPRNDEGEDECGPDPAREVLGHGSAAQFRRALVGRHSSKIGAIPLEL